MGHLDQSDGQPHRPLHSAEWETLLSPWQFLLLFLVVIPEGNLLLFLVSLRWNLPPAFVSYVFAVILSEARDPEELHAQHPFGPFQLNVCLVLNQHGSRASIPFQNHRIKTITLMHTRQSPQPPVTYHRTQLHPMRQNPLLSKFR
jgi:hypothetical protein